jgi:predicted small lipoprotein YifL
MTRLLAFALVAVSLAACGRLGPIRPPGPAESITYPRQYPVQPRPAAPPADPPASPAPR